jgi:hypothetical protein
LVDDRALFTPVVHAAVTYNAHGPKYTVINKQPGLLRKTDLFLLLRHALQSGKRCQNILHEASSQECEEHNAESNEVGVVEANGKLAGLVVVVGELEIFVGMRSSFGDEAVA